MVGDGIEWFIYQSTGKKAGYAEINLFWSIACVF